MPVLGRLPLQDPLAVVSRRCPGRNRAPIRAQITARARSSTWQRCRARHISSMKVDAECAVHDRVASTIRHRAAKYAQCGQARQVQCGPIRQRWQDRWAGKEVPALSVPACSTPMPSRFAIGSTSSVQRSGAMSIRVQNLGSAIARNS